MAKLRRRTGIHYVDSRGKAKEAQLLPRVHLPLLKAGLMAKHQCQAALGSTSSAATSRNAWQRSCGYFGSRPFRPVRALAWKMENTMHGSKAAQSTIPLPALVASSVRSAY